MKYIKLFDEHSLYNTYIKSTNAIFPNLSHCIKEYETHLLEYDKYLICEYEILDTEGENGLYNIELFWHSSEDERTAATLFNEVIIDDETVSIEELDLNEGYYVFNSPGIHTVKYYLIDKTSIKSFIFLQISHLKKVIVPKYQHFDIIAQTFRFCTNLEYVDFANVKRIGGQSFSGCTKLKNIILPKTVTDIYMAAFYNCTSLGTVTLLSETPPNLTSTAFYKNPATQMTNIIFYVPAGSVELYKTARNWDEYANQILAIPEE